MYSVELYRYIHMYYFYLISLLRCYGQCAKTIFRTHGKASIWYLPCWRLLDGQLHHTWSHRGNHRQRGSARDGSLVAHSPAEKIKQKHPVRETDYCTWPLALLLLELQPASHAMTVLCMIGNDGSHFPLQLLPIRTTEKNILTLSTKTAHLRIILNLFFSMGYMHTGRIYFC